MPSMMASTALVANGKNGKMPIIVGLNIAENVGR
jgi:hypothetical protein